MTETSIYKKYKTELDLIEKYIKNKIVYKYIHDWGTNKDGKFYELHSQVSVFECIFIHFLVSSLNKKSLKCINVLEIGCAYGTSAMVITNAMNKFTHQQKLTYTVIDPNQSTQWQGVGFYNIKRLRTAVKKEYIEEFSTPAMRQLLKKKKRFNLIFIDGSHEYSVVLNDCKYSDKLLKKCGLVVLDDVMHSGVAKVVKQFYRTNANYRQVEISKKDKKIIKRHTKGGKQDIYNPTTMFAFQKLE
jgi:predicted O-methyltransferase YrrM